MEDAEKKNPLHCLQQMNHTLNDFEESLIGLKEIDSVKDTDAFSMDMFEDIEQTSHDDKEILQAISNIRERLGNLVRQLGSVHADTIRKIDLKEKQNARSTNMFIRDRDDEDEVDDDEYSQCHNIKKPRKDIVIDVNNEGIIINNAFISSGLNKLSENDVHDNSLNAASINVATSIMPPTCVERYKLSGDSYDYTFYPDEYKTISEYYFSIGSCLFYGCEKAFGFDYFKYKKFVHNMFGTCTKAGLIFDPNDSDKGIVGEWDNNLSTRDKSNAVAVWASLTKTTRSTDPSKVRYYFQIANAIEELTDDQYVVLSFGQYQQISPFMKKYIFKKNKYWRTWRKFQNLISVTFLRCKFHNSKTSKIKNEKWCDDCDKELTIILDMLHRFVIIKVSGTHGKQCDEYNRMSGYTEFRNLLLNKNVDDQEDAMNSVREEYSECFDDVIMQLGQLPTTIEYSNWVTQRGRITSENTASTSLVE